MVARLSCQCGKLCVAFHDPKPRHRADCCCVECQESFDWVMKAGCQPCSIPRTKDLLYFTNDVSVEKGEDNLKWVIMRDEGTPRFYADCCKTMLGMVHPTYNGTLVMCYNFPGAGIFSGVEMIPFDLRWFQYDLTLEELKAYPSDLPAPGKHLIYPLRGVAAVARFILCTLKPVPLPRSGVDIKTSQDKFGEPLNAKLPKLAKPQITTNKSDDSDLWCLTSSR